MRISQERARLPCGCRPRRELSAAQRSVKVLLPLELVSPDCRRPISVRKNTRLKRSWQEAETCSSSVELTFSAVTASTARMVAVRLAPGT